MPATEITLLDPERIPKPLLRKWGDEFARPMSHDHSPMSYEDMARRICRRILLKVFLQPELEEPVELLGYPYGELHDILGDFDEHGFPDPKWEGAYNDVWREITKEVEAASEVLDTNEQGPPCPNPDCECYGSSARVGPSSVGDDFYCYECCCTF